LLEEELAALRERVKELDVALRNLSAEQDAVAWFAVAQARADALDRIAALKKDLNESAFVTASDLLNDTSQWIREPRIVAESEWYRPVLWGAVGLAIGLGLAAVVTGFAIIRAIFRADG
jgi:hypothetical protein